MSSDQNCPIWGTPARSTSAGNTLQIFSARTGGTYVVTGSALPSLAALSIEQKVQLTWWLVEQRRLGQKAPEITAETAKEIRQVRLPDLLERRDRILDYISGSSSTITPRIALSGIVTDRMREEKANLAALTASQNDAEVNELVRFLREDGLVQGDGTVALTFKAWRYIEQRRTQRPSTVQGFVAMWFNKEMEAVYSNGFEAAIRDAGYEPMRIDQKEHINKIDDEIIAEIRRSRFLVADFTSEPDRPRGGVYFEAGFAFGLGIPVIWSCRDDLIGQLHFDIRQFNHIVWSKSDDLRTKLCNRISAVLGDGPGILN